MAAADGSNPLNLTRHLTVVITEADKRKAEEELVRIKKRENTKAKEKLVPLNLTQHLAVVITEADKRKAKEELIQARTSRKREVEEELRQTRTCRKRKAEEELVRIKKGKNTKAKEKLVPLNLTRHLAVVITEADKRKAEEELVQTRTSRKRKAEEEANKTPRKRVCTSHPCMISLNWSDPAFFNGTSASSSPGPKITIDNSVKFHTSTRDFKSKYCEYYKILLGKGGFGSVVSGIRRSDSKPVAIKHIPKNKVQHTWVKYQDKDYTDISEVVFMVQAAGLYSNGSEANPAIIGVLDVYVLRREVLIIMEKPLEAMDINKFYILRKGQIPEGEAKIIFKQLVHAALLMQKNGIFHRDIKGGNILVSPHEGNLPIQIIDFGCSTVVREKPYTRYAGTLSYAPPELFLQRQYNAEPTTVWQIGATLRNLYSKRRFHIRNYMRSPNPPFIHLSHECNNFMNQCLSINPNQRPGLEELQQHPWLN